MSQKTKQITNPQAEKQHLVFRRTGAETNGELLEMEARYAPGGVYPPEHYHPHQDEHFEVLKGQLQVRLNGREYTFQAGQTIDIPRGTIHTMRNGGDSEAKVIWQVRPAMKTQAFFETLYGLAADGRTNRDGVPNLLQLAVLLRNYRDEFVLSWPPLPLQRLLLGALAGVGKLLGYRGWYEKYSGPEVEKGWQEAQASIWINQTPETVFRFVANYKNDTRWRKGVACMTQSPIDRTEVGTVTHEEKNLLGQRFVVIAKITAFEADRRLDWASIESAIPVKGYRLVEPEGNGARFTQVIRGNPKGLYRWLAPLMMYTLKKEMAQDVARLKAILEQGDLQK